ncbi:hypothetical protein vseg_013814 [Gypsophila vaccaria]
MQCQSYLSLYQSEYDLKVDTNTCSRVMYDGKATFRNGLSNTHVSIFQLPQSNIDYKELLWKTMLMHEHTFRDQVQELHRLYKRHREMITEIKSKEISTKHVHIEVQSSTSSSPILLSSSGRETKIIQRCFHSTEELKAPAVPLSLRNNGTLDEFAGYKGKMIGGKPLDLELPAEVYIDSDEWDSLQGPRYAEDPTSANLSTNKHGKPIVEADGTASTVNAQPQGDTPRPCSDQGTKRHLVDLNEPPTTLQYEDSDSHPDVLSSSCGSSDKKPSLSTEKKPLVVQALPSLDSYSRSRKNGKYSRKSVWSVKRNLDFGGKTSTDVIKEKKTRVVQKNGMSEVSVSCDNVCTKQNGASCVNSLNDVNLRKSKSCRVIDINLSCDTASDDELFTSLPRGYSEDNQTEDDDSLGELVKVAAQAIVSMSCRALSFSETKNCRHSQVSDSKALEWFAGLVDEVGSLRHNEVDDFEVMTLNLCETKSEEYSFVEIPSQTCSVSMSLMAGPTRKGRTRRPKIKKDFQGDVLPSLASLSRYEVSEDMQLIEGLMEAAGTPWHLRARRACRTGRKPRAIIQQGPSPDLPELKVEFGLSWGKDNKRPRGRRSRVSSDTIMSRWLELLYDSSW